MRRCYWTGDYIQHKVISLLLMSDYADDDDDWCWWLMRCWCVPFQVIRPTQPTLAWFSVPCASFIIINWSLTHLQIASHEFKRKLNVIFCALLHLYDLTRRIHMHNSTMHTTQIFFVSMQCNPTTHTVLYNFHWANMEEPKSDLYCCYCSLNEGDWINGLFFRSWLAHAH